MALLKKGKPRTIEKTCAFCGKPFLADADSRLFCGKSCSASALAFRPGERDRRSAAMRGCMLDPTSALRRAVLRRMNTHNPMLRPETREKVSKALRGRSMPHLTGGNGAALTVPQQALLMLLTGWVPEYVVWACGQSPALLEKYERWGLMTLDLANPGMKLGVEVDGPSHNTNAARLRDRKKDRLLKKAGWRVLRIKNEAVLTSPVGAALQILSCLEVSPWQL